MKSKWLELSTILMNVDGTDCRRGKAYHAATANPHLSKTKTATLLCIFPFRLALTAPGTSTSSTCLMCSFGKPSSAWSYAIPRFPAACMRSSDLKLWYPCIKTNRTNSKSRSMENPVFFQRTWCLFKKKSSKKTGSCQRTDQFKGFSRVRYPVVSAHVSPNNGACLKPKQGRPKLCNQTLLCMK